MTRTGLVSCAITTKVVSLNPVHGKVNLIQHYVIVSQWLATGLWFSLCAVCLRFTRGFAQRFFIWNKFYQEGTILHTLYINQKCYFLLWLFQLRWTLAQHFQVFHVNKPNKSLVTSKREYHKDKMAGLSRWNQLISKHFLL
jgi:hypothetical protein